MLNVIYVDVYLCGRQETGKIQCSAKNHWMIQLSFYAIFVFFNPVQMEDKDTGGSGA